MSAGVRFLAFVSACNCLADRGLEHGTHEGLGWIGGEVSLIEPADKALKIPHMGWNTLTFLRPHPLFEGIPGGPDGWHAYFVHSYQFQGRGRGRCRGRVRLWRPGYGI